MTANLPEMVREPYESESGFVCRISSSMIFAFLGCERSRWKPNLFASHQRVLFVLLLLRSQLRMDVFGHNFR